MGDEPVTGKSGLTRQAAAYGLGVMTLLNFVNYIDRYVLPAVAPLIKACSDPALLEEWALAAPRLADDEFLALVRSEASAVGRRAPAPRPVRGRAPRPSRRSRPSKRR